jgi:hypothetical protein
MCDWGQHMGRGTAAGRGIGDAGQETVGHALLIAVAAGGVLMATRLSNVVVAAFESFRLPVG